MDRWELNRLPVVGCRAPPVATPTCSTPYVSPSPLVRRPCRTILYRISSRGRRACHPIVDVRYSTASLTPHLWRPQEGDFIPPPSNAFSRCVFAIYDSSFIVRWIIYIIPLMALLWIPGIIGLTWKPEATVWTVPLVWWSAWLSVAWGGWWGAALGEYFGFFLSGGRPRLGVMQDGC